MYNLHYHLTRKTDLLTTDKYGFYIIPWIEYGWRLTDRKRLKKTAWLHFPATLLSCANSGPLSAKLAEGISEICHHSFCDFVGPFVNNYQLDGFIDYSQQE